MQTQTAFFEECIFVSFRNRKFLSDVLAQTENQSELFLRYTLLAKDNF